MATPGTLYAGDFRYRRAEEVNHYNRLLEAIQNSCFFGRGTPLQQLKTHSMNQVFVSYSSKDKDFALQLVSDLERFYDVWIDKGELEGGLEWEQMIDAALQEC